MTKNKTILSQNWSFRAKNAEHGSKANISKNKGKVKIKKWSKNWSFRANNWPKIATKKKKNISKANISKSKGKV